VVHQALAGALADLDPGASVVGVSGAGCASLVHAYLDLPFVAAPFGRGPSVARGLVLVRPELTPVVYAGEGELAGEGLADLLRAAAAGAPQLVLMVESHGGAEGGSCQRQGLGGAGGASLDPRGLVAGLGAPATEAPAEDAAACREALSEALAAVTSGRGFHFLALRGRCPAIGQEP
jgi:hypothetical protein